MIYITILLFAYLVYKCWKRRNEAIEARRRRWSRLMAESKQVTHDTMEHVKRAKAEARRNGFKSGRVLIGNDFKSLEEAKEQYYEHITEAGREGK